MALAEAACKQRQHAQYDTHVSMHSAAPRSAPAVVTPQGCPYLPGHKEAAGLWRKVYSAHLQHVRRQAMDSCSSELLCQRARKHMLARYVSTLKCIIARAHTRSQMWL